MHSNGGGTRGEHREGFRYLLWDRGGTYGRFALVHVTFRMEIFSERGHAPWWRVGFLKAVGLVPALGSGQLRVNDRVFLVESCDSGNSFVLALSLNV